MHNIILEVFPEAKIVSRPTGITVEDSDTEKIKKLELELKFMQIEFDLEQHEQHVFKHRKDAVDMRTMSTEQFSTYKKNFKLKQKKIQAYIDAIKSRFYCIQ